VIKLLQKIIPIERAQMRIRLDLPAKAAKAIKSSHGHLFKEIEEEAYLNTTASLVRSLSASLSSLIFCHSLFPPSSSSSFLTASFFSFSRWF
jgi:hypothetical protein